MTIWNRVLKLIMSNMQSNIIIVEISTFSTLFTHKQFATILGCKKVAEQYIEPGWKTLVTFQFSKHLTEY